MRWRRRTFSIAIGVIVGFGTLAAIWLLARPLALTFIALTLAESLRPVVALAARRVPHTLAVLAVYAVLVLLAVGAVALLGPVAIEQARQLIVQAPDLVTSWLHSLTRLTRGTGLQAASALRSLVASGAASLLAVPLTIGKSVLEALVVVFLSLYWLLESPRLWPFVMSLLPPGRRDEVAAVTRDVGHAIGGYFRGAAINAVVMAVLAATALAIAGIQYPLVLGVATAAGELVPYVGPIVVGVLATGVGLLESPEKAVAAALIFVVLEQVEGHVLTPTIMRSQTNVSATLVIIALLLGGTAGGLVGALAAVPFAAASRTIVVEVLAPRIRQRSQAAD